MKTSLMMVSVIALGLGAVNAWAVDNRIQPGTICHQIGGVPSVNYNWEGGIENTSTTAAIQVLCPIVRDNTGNSPSYMQVSVRDHDPLDDSTSNPSVDDVGCQLWSSDITHPAEGETWGTWVQSSGSQATKQQLVFNWHDNAYSLGSEAVTCVIARNTGLGVSSVVGYYVSE